MVHYVYLITNKINNKKYIGKHSGELDDNYLGSGENIRAAIKKYGKENFEKTILYIADSEEECYAAEEKIIKDFNAVESDEYYNISPGGQYKYKKVALKDRSYTQTKEYRENMSKAVSGERNGMYGRHHTEESKQKISQNRVGKASGKENGMYGHSKNNALNGKWIGMYDENNNLMKIFKAKTAVLEYLGLKGHTQLDKALKEGTLYKNYYWKVVPKEKRSVETK